MIIDIAAAVLAQAAMGVPGKTLFLYHAPDNIPSCILIIDGFDGIPRDEALPGYKKTEFKVIIRHGAYQSAMTIAKRVMTALDLHRETVNGIYVNRMRATHEPIAFPIPDSDVIEVSVNIWAAFVEL